MISPWAIYLVSVLITADKIAEFVLGVSLVCTIVFMLFYFGLIFAEDKSKVSKEDIEGLTKWLKRSSIVAAVSAVFVCLIPSEETMYAMLIVDQLTPENIKALRDFGVETVQQLGDAIANSINKIEVK